MWGIEKHSKKITNVQHQWIWELVYTTELAISGGGSGGKRFGWGLDGIEIMVVEGSRLLVDGLVLTHCTYKF